MFQLGPVFLKLNAMFLTHVAMMHTIFYGRNTYRATVLESSCALLIALIFQVGFHMSVAGKGDAAVASQARQGSHYRPHEKVCPLST